MKSLFLIALLVVLLSSIALAEPMLIVEVDSFDAPTGFDNIWVLDDNGYEDSRWFEDHTEDSTSIEIITEDSAGNVVEKVFLQGITNILKYDKKIANIKVVSATAILVEKSVGFCNDNNKCEPCEGSSCTLIENALTCSDCSSGSTDYFCDTISDGICDPDCDFDPADSDCQSNCTESCGVDLSTALTCEDYKGTACTAAQDCIDGYSVYAADSMYCCIGGTCGITGEYVATKVQAANYPTYTKTPSGLLASTVLSQGVDSYCENSLNGEVCGSTEYCQGTSTEFYYNTFCCRGTCIDTVNRTPEYLAEVENDTNLPIPEDQVEALFNVSAVENETAEELSYDNITFAGDDPDVADRAASQYALEEEIESEQKTEELKESIKKVVSPITKKAEGFNVIWFAVVLLGVIVVVMLFLAVFRHSASSKMLEESRAAEEVEKPQVDMQSLINAYVSKGYNYTQARTLLVRAGYQQDMVNAEIRKNYELRKQIQSGQK